jgi:hypothetical protein
LRAYRAIARDFEGLRDIKVLAIKQNYSLRAIHFEKRRRAQAEAYTKQLREAGEIRSLWMKPFDAEQSRSFRSEATVRVADWRKKRESTVDSIDRRLARRILSQLMVESFEAAQPSLAVKDYNQALANFFSWPKPSIPRAQPQFRNSASLWFKASKNLPLNHWNWQLNLGSRMLSELSLKKHLQSSPMILATRSCSTLCINSRPLISSFSDVMELK